MSQTNPTRPAMLVIQNQAFLLNAAEMLMAQLPAVGRAADQAQAPAPAGAFPPPTERITELGKCLGEMGVALWRAQQALEKDAEGEAVDRKMYRALEAMQAALTKAGVENIDRLGTNLSNGHYRDIAVVATEPSADVQQEIIVETIKPAVHWRHGFPHVGPETVLVQASEVVTKSPLTSPPSPQA